MPSPKQVQHVVIRSISVAIDHSSPESNAFGHGLSKLSPNTAGTGSLEMAVPNHVSHLLALNEWIRSAQWEDHRILQYQPIAFTPVIMP